MKIRGWICLLALVSLSAAELDERKLADIKAKNDRGEVTDDASPQLRRIRNDVRVAYDRLMQKLQDFMSTHRSVVQEPNSRTGMPSSR